MTNSNQKGARKERELATYFDDEGWAVIRAPASGSATDRELPDVLAGDGNVFYAIEAKASSGDPIYYDEAEIAALEYFADGFRAAPLLGARFDETYGDPSYGESWPGWYFLAPTATHRTKGGSYRVKKDHAETHGTPLIDL